MEQGEAVPHYEEVKIELLTLIAAAASGTGLDLRGEGLKGVLAL
jgi:hypothetical protein